MSGGNGKKERYNKESGQKTGHPCCFPIPWTGRYSKREALRPMAGGFSFFYRAKSDKFFVSLNPVNTGDLFSYCFKTDKVLVARLQGNGFNDFGLIYVIIIQSLRVIGFRLGQRYLGVNNVKVGPGTGTVFHFGNT